MRPHALPRVGASHQRALVIDDDPECGQLLAHVLRADGLDVEVTCDGEAGLRLLDAQPPDIALVDVGLPGIDGIEVCRAIKERWSTRLIPVVLLTGRPEREFRLAGLDGGADDFVAKPFDVEELRARVRQLLRMKRYTDDLESAESVIVSLALTVEARDSYTEGHCERLAAGAVALGATCGLGETDLAALGRGGFLHDVGKIGIPDAVLLKTGPLTAAEYALIQQHPEIGERLLGDLRSLAAVRPIVRHHHERLDGSGYPDGLRGDAIPLLAQIVSIVDVFDAMTSARPYRPAFPRTTAVAELQREKAAGRLNPVLVEAFLSIEDPFDLGASLVRERWSISPAGAPAGGGAPFAAAAVRIPRDLASA